MVRELPVVVLVSFITMFIVEAIKVSADFDNILTTSSYINIIYMSQNKFQNQIKVMVLPLTAVFSQRIS
jgi:hypothetical protein